MAITGGILMDMGGGIMIENMSTMVFSALYPERRRFFMNPSQVVFYARVIAGPTLTSWQPPHDMSWRFFIGVAAISSLLVILFPRTQFCQHQRKMNGFI